MKLTHINKICLTIFILLSGTLLFAADIQPRFALVIGNQNYQEGKLKNPIADAKLIAERLEDCAFSVYYKEDLSLSDLKKTVLDYADMVNAAGSDVISVVYYSGHGVQIEGQNYIVPVDNGAIKTEAEAEMNCFSVSDIFKYVKAKTQVFILDACRDNPFKSDKKIFSKGLSTMQAPKGVNFMYLFSTKAGATAADGDGKNSLFTEVLGEELKKYNVPVNTVFSNVSLNVTEKTGGRQAPLYTGISVDFEFLNEAVADYQITKLTNRMNDLKAKEKKESDKDVVARYKTEENLLEGDIKHAKDVKAKVKADADEKAKKAKEQAERDKKLKQETEKIRKQTEALLKQQQLLKAKQQSSTDFINQIEGDKIRLKEIRKMAFEKILKADEETSKRTEIKIEEIHNQDYKMTDLTSTGELTSAAKKRTDAQINKVLDEDQKEKISNEKEFHDLIREEETHLVSEIEKNNKALGKTTYIASSVLDEARFNVIDRYDGEKLLWNVRVYSNLFGDQSLVNVKMDVPYMKLADVKKIDRDSDEYNDSVEKFDYYLRDSELKALFDVQIKYTITPQDAVNSIYTFKASEVSIYYNDSSKENNTARLISSKKVSFTRTIRWTDAGVERVKTISELYADYDKEQAEIRKAEAAKKKQEEKEAAALQKMEEREARLRAKALEPSLSEKIEKWGGNQSKLDGFQFDVLLGIMNGVQTGWNFGINDYLSIEPVLSVCGKTTVVDKDDPSSVTFASGGGVGVVVKGHINYTLPNNTLLIPIAHAGVLFNTATSWDLQLGASLEWQFTVEDLPLSVGIDGLFSIPAESAPGGIFGIYMRVPLETVSDVIAAIW